MIFLAIAGVVTWFKVQFRLQHIHTQNHCGFQFCVKRKDIQKLTCGCQSLSVEYSLGQIGLAFKTKVEG